MKKMGQGIKLPDEIKEKARVLLTEGYSINYISKVLKISRVSVRTARDERDNLDALRQDKKEEIIKTLWGKVKIALSFIDSVKLKNSSAYQLMTIAAIAVDKAQLLTGEATDILQVKTEGELDRELKELQVAERELKEAWEKANKKRAEAKAKDGKSKS